MKCEVSLLPYTATGSHREAHPNDDVLKYSDKDKDRTHPNDEIDALAADDVVRPCTRRVTGRWLRLINS